MHESNPGRLIIDCRSVDLGQAPEFRTRALGFAPADSDDEKYQPPDSAPGEAPIEPQRVDRPSRVPADIEAGDVEDEVPGPEGPGAIQPHSCNYRSTENVRCPILSMP